MKPFAVGSAELPEIRELLTWMGNPASGGPKRHPQQTHGLNESDAEVVRLRPDLYLATTTDSVSEEWLCGLYRDTFTLGWMTASASLSDLAAVGADPVGVLLSVEWSKEFDALKKARFAEGFRAAVEQAKTYWLGGDTGHSGSAAFVGVGLGTTDSMPMNRLGLQPGQVLGLLSGQKHTPDTGIGPALGIRFIREEEDSAFPESRFRPQPQLAEGAFLRKAGVKTCIDTSDGILTSLLILSHLNAQCGFELEWNPDHLNPAARAALKNWGFPEFLLWIIEHGDYELLFAAEETRFNQLQHQDPRVRRLGRVTPAGSGFQVRHDKTVSPLPAPTLRALIGDASKSWQQRLNELTQEVRRLGLP